MSEDSQTETIEMSIETLATLLGVPPYLIASAAHALYPDMKQKRHELLKEIIAFTRIIKSF